MKQLKFTDIQATFRVIRREMAAAAEKLRANKVRQIK